MIDFCGITIQWESSHRAACRQKSAQKGLFQTFSEINDFYVSIGFDDWVNNCDLYDESLEAKGKSDVEKWSTGFEAPLRMAEIKSDLPEVANSSVIKF